MTTPGPAAYTYSTDLPGPATGLDIAAIICAIVVAPVGVILGIVSRVSAKRKGLVANRLSLVAIIVGSVLTAIQALLVALPLILVAAFAGPTAIGGPGVDQGVDPCATLTTHASDLADYASLFAMGSGISELEWRELAEDSRHVNEVATSIVGMGASDGISATAQALVDETDAILSAADGPLPADADVLISTATARAVVLVEQISLSCSAG